jgi:hypothetical protein
MSVVLCICSAIKPSAGHERKRYLRGAKRLKVPKNLLYDTLNYVVGKGHVKYLKNMKSGRIWMKNLLILQERSGKPYSIFPLHLTCNNRTQSTVFMLLSLIVLLPFVPKQLLLDLRILE